MRWLTALWEWLVPEQPSCSACTHAHEPARTSPCCRCPVSYQGRQVLTRYERPEPPRYRGHIPPRPMPAPAPRTPRNIAHVPKP